MSNEHSPPEKISGILRATALMTFALWLPVTAPAQATEPLDVQQKVDEALGADKLPAPVQVHFPAPDTRRPPLTGQPYEQQPAAAQDNFLVPGGGRP